MRGHPCVVCRYPKERTTINALVRNEGNCIRSFPTTNSPATGCLNIANLASLIKTLSQFATKKKLFHALTTEHSGKPEGKNVGKPKAGGEGL
jgi:hypothetical protein